MARTTPPADPHTPYAFDPNAPMSVQIMQNENIDIDNLPDLLTIEEVSNLLRVSRITIKRWGKRGKLEAIRINSRGDRRFKKEAVLWLLGITPPEPSEESQRVLEVG